MAGPTLRLNLDPMGVKQGARDVDAAFDKVKQGAKETEVAIGKTSSATQTLGQRLTHVSKNMSGQQRFVLQNTTNQFGDMAVQMAMGTGAMRTMGQQLPQLFAGFAILGGTLGTVAPILGVIAAVGFPIAAMFTNMGGEAQGLSDKLDALGEHIDNIDKNFKLSTTSVDKLRQKYGELALDVKAAAQATVEFDLYQGLRDAKALQGELIDTFQQTRTVGEKALRIVQDNAQAFMDMGLTLPQIDNLVNIMSRFDVGIEPAQKIQSAVERIAAASTETELAEALLQFNQVLLRSNPNSDEAADIIEKIAKQSKSAGEMVAYMVTQLQNFSREAVTATASSSGLNTALGTVTDGSFDFDINDFTSDTTDPESLLMRQSLTPDKAAGQAARAARRKLDAENKAAAAKAEAARKAEITRLQNIAKQYKPALTAAQEYNKAMTDLNKAVAMGAISQEQHSIATAEATRRYQIASGEAADYGAVMNTFANALENNLMSVIDGTMSVQDAFKSMASAVIKELFRVLVVQQMVNAAMGAFGYSPAAGGGYVKTGVGAYGGEAQAGNAMIVGEKGPELFIPQTGGQIVPNSSMGGDVIVQQTINVTTGVQQTVRNEIRTLLPQIAESAKGAVLDAKRRGGNYRKAFA